MAFVVQAGNQQDSNGILAVCASVHACWADALRVGYSASVHCIAICITKILCVGNEVQQGAAMCFLAHMIPLSLSLWLVQAASWLDKEVEERV